MRQSQGEGKVVEMLCMLYHHKGDQHLEVCGHALCRRPYNQQTRQRPFTHPLDHFHPIQCSHASVLHHE